MPSLGCPIQKEVIMWLWQAWGSDMELGAFSAQEGCGQLTWPGSLEGRLSTRKKRTGKERHDGAALGYTPRKVGQRSRKAMLG